jgi:transcription elongation factor Elf1
MLATEETRREFKDLVDRSMIITVLRCQVCGRFVGRIEHPQTAKLDRISDVVDHLKETGHSEYDALAHFIVYMCQADKELADELSKVQKEAFDKFMKSFNNKP